MMDMKDKDLLKAIRKIVREELDKKFPLPILNEDERNQIRQFAPIELKMEKDENR